MTAPYEERVSEVENLKERLRLLDAVAAEQISRVLAEKDERIAELEKLRRSTVSQESYDQLLQQRDEIQQKAVYRKNLLLKCLLSADPEWEKQNLGHDWADWCEEARREVLPNKRYQL